MSNIIIKDPNVIFTFYHIEKCAGTSLRFELYNYFSQLYNKNLIFMPEVNNIGKHVNLTNNDYINIVRLGKEFINFINYKKIFLCHISCNDDIFKLNPMFKITCIRHPLTRVISHYNYFDKPLLKKEFYELNDHEFNEWFKQKGNLTIFRLTNSHNNLKLAKQNLLKMNHVIMTHNYDHDIKILGNKLDDKFKRPFFYIKLKKNRNNNKKVFYHHKFIEKILFKLKDEMELYNFYKKCKRAFKKIA